MLQWSPAAGIRVKAAKDSLLLVYRSAPPENRWDAYDMSPYWMAAVGRELSRRTRPTWFADGHLTVDVDGAEWREQLFPLSGQILARLNKLLGKPLVHRIHYRLARPQRRPPGRADVSRPEPCDEASGIQDPQLRRLYRASMKRSR
jgi:hypothetical protein